MALKFVTNIDLNKNQIVNATFELAGFDPVNDLFPGRMYYNSATDSIRVYSGSAWKPFVNSIVSGGSYSTALTVNESNGEVTLTLNLASGSAAGLMTAADFTKLADATASATANKLVLRDVNGNISVAIPSQTAHAATKGYVDSARQGLDVKASVVVATTGDVVLANELENGDVIDGITLVTGDRVLVKNQSTASQNGIYVVQVTGAAVRATDANGTVDTGEVSGGTFTFVEQGTINADSGWVVTSNGTIAVGTDAIDWVQFSGAGQITAGAGLDKDGNTLSVNVVADRTAITSDAVDIASTYVGQSSITTLGTITTGVWTGTDVAVLDGGTGASTSSDARTNLADGGSQGGGVSVPVLTRKVVKLCAAATSTTVIHAFSTTDVMVQVYDVVTGETVIADQARTDSNTVTVTFSVAPASGAYQIVVIG